MFTISSQVFLVYITYYWMTLRTGEDILIWRRRLWIALCGGIVLEEALDLSSDRILNEWMNEWIPTFLIGHILRRNCLLKQVIEGKIKGEMEVTRRRRRRRKKLLDDLKDRRWYSHLKEEALDRTMWRHRFGGGFGPVVRQNTEWMIEWNLRTDNLFLSLPPTPGSCSHRDTYNDVLSIPDMHSLVWRCIIRLRGVTRLKRWEHYGFVISSGWNCCEILPTTFRVVF